VAELPAETGVSIVGAGPTGLTLGCLLAQAGVDFVLLERADRPHEHSRAAAVQARTLEVLEDAGVSDTLVERGLRVPRVTIRTGDRRLATIGLDGLPTRYPYVLFLPQEETEAVLEQRLEQLGGRVLRRREVTGVDVEPDACRLAIGGGELRARRVVAADGARSAVRAAAGVGFRGGTYEQRFALADVRMDWPLPADEVVLFLAEDGLLVFFPLPGGVHRIVAQADLGREPTLEDVQGLVDTRGPRRAHVRVQELVWSSDFRIHHRVAERFRAGPILLIGDAAHVHSPAGGQGMNVGIQDAHALAPILARGAGGAEVDAELGRWADERRSIAAGVVAFTDRATRLATLHGRPARAVRDAGLRIADRVPPVRRRAAFRMSQLSLRRH